jgi:hypothetical protein
VGGGGTRRIGEGRIGRKVMTSGAHKAVYVERKSGKICLVFEARK